MEDRRDFDPAPHSPSCNGWAYVVLDGTAVPSSGNDKLASTLGRQGSRLSTGHPGIATSRVRPTTSDPVRAAIEDVHLKRGDV
jgi:hypothetical protein